MRWYSYSWQDLSSTPASPLIFLFHLVLPCHSTPGTTAALPWDPQEGWHLALHPCSASSHSTNLLFPLHRACLELHKVLLFLQTIKMCVLKGIYAFKDPCCQQDFHRLWVKEPICRKLLCGSCTVITLTAPQSSLKVTLNTAKLKTCFKTMKLYIYKHTKIFKIASNIECYPPKWLKLIRCFWVIQNAAWPHLNSVLVYSLAFLLIST